MPHDEGFPLNAYNATAPRILFVILLIQKSKKDKYIDIVYHIYHKIQVYFKIGRFRAFYS